MFMRLLQLNIEQGQTQNFKSFYEATVIPTLKEMPGCEYAALIENSSSANELISLTLWGDQASAENYENSEIYSEFRGRISSYLSDSSEWKVQLSENLELEYKPLKEEPVIRNYNVAAQSVEGMKDTAGKNSLHVRIVSAKIQKGKETEFSKIYSSEIIPSLLATKGCLYANLTQNLESENSYISLTVWRSKEEADLYEESGQFDRNVKKVIHAFSDFYRWKLALEKDSGTSIKTSEDLSISKYVMVAGKKF